MVAARDGVTLATDVYAPGRGGSAATGRFPTIVERTVYNKDSVAEVLTKYFVPRGYVVVTQDVRGRYRSGGTLAADPRRWPGWRGPAEVDCRAAVVERQGRDRGHVVRRRHAARHRHHQRAEPRGHGAGGRDEQRRAVRRPPQRRVRVALAELDLQPRQRHRSACLGHRTGADAERRAGRGPSRLIARRRWQRCRNWARACRSTRWRCRCGPGPRRSSSRPSTRPG